METGLQKFIDLSMVTELGIEGIHTEIYVYLFSYYAIKSGANISE